ncbi:MAG: hypothetical protein HC897_13525 [Thermoanaerobaculia bacterium]|nr:hypothetical protein [Thermoanaerobaculia bacterium]
MSQGYDGRTMSDHLTDLFAHMLWADAASWRALEAHPAAIDDPQIRERLHHIHIVQRAFGCILRGEEVAYRKLEDYASMTELKADARRYGEEIQALHAGYPTEVLAETVDFPWFKDPPIVLTRGEALLQVVMHSQHHRGQNSARLRELGGEPPMLDFIIWIWKSRPRPEQ